MTTTHLRERLIQEVDCIPADRLGEVLDFLHFFRLGIESTTRQASPSPRRQPSPRLACRGARLMGDDITPAIPLEDWGPLFQGDTETHP